MEVQGEFTVDHNFATGKDIMRRDIFPRLLVGPPGCVLQKLSAVCGSITKEVELVLESGTGELLRVLPSGTELQTLLMGPAFDKM